MTEELIGRRSGESAFLKGRIYFKQGRVENLEVTDTVASASVSGTYAYEVRLECAGAEIVGECSCPQGADGAFCKHCVATALAWMERAGPLTLSEPEDAEPTATATATADDARLRAFLASQEPAWLVGELIRAAEAYPLVRARLDVAAGADESSTVNAKGLRKQLKRAINDGLRPESNRRLPPWRAARPPLNGETPDPDDCLDGRNRTGVLLLCRKARLPLRYDQALRGIVRDHHPDRHSHRESDRPHAE